MAVACLQAFLDMKQLMAHLEGILRQCRELCALIQVCRHWLALSSPAQVCPVEPSPVQCAMPSISTCRPPPLDRTPTTLQRLADGSMGMEAAAEALRGITREFSLKQRILYQIMQSSKLGSRAPALRQLVTRLNFNEFADKQALRGAAGSSAVGSFPLRSAPATSAPVEA